MSNPQPQANTESQTGKAKRLDQNLTEEGQRHIQELLGKFPDLRSVALAFDYELQDAGSLPAGVWLSRRSLNVEEVVAVCRAVDRVGNQLRDHHDAAVRQLVKEALQLKEKLTQQQKPPSKEENESDAKKPTG